MLLAIHDHGGVAAAARALSFTPPAVSQQVAALERQLGVTLLDRSQRAARLTSAGQRLAGHAERVLATLEAAEADMAAVGVGITGVLRVGAIPTMARALLPATLARLRLVAPDLQLRIQQMEAEESLPALKRGELDVVLAGEYRIVPARPSPWLERRDLWIEDVLVAVPDGHQLAGTEVGLARLADAEWLAPTPGSACHALLQRSCGMAGFEPRLIGHCGDFDVALALVAAGHGIALVPRLAVASDPAPRVRLLTPVDPVVQRTLFAAVRRGAGDHPAIACFIDALPVPPEIDESDALPPFAR